MKLKIKKKYIIIAAIVSIVAMLAIFYLDHSISRDSENLIYRNINDVPAKKVALVLGTAKYTFGQENLFYNYRLKAAAQLYHAGKIKAILVSGDNSRIEYNEPISMQKDLIKLGVPATCINLDYAGFRTLDSIVRAKKVFDVDDYIIVSQTFHCQRALYIARAKGHKAIAYPAQDIHGAWGAKVRMREVAARVKAFIDLYILNKKPKFLGKKEKIHYGKTAGK